MKVLPALTFAGNASTVFAIGTRAAAYDPFQVDGFSAACTPHSIDCWIEFTVVTNPNFPVVSCQWNGAGPDMIPPIPLTGCNYSTVSFSFEGPPVAHVLTVVASETTSQAPGENLTATYHFTPADFTLTDHGSVVDESYSGVSAFPINDVAETGA
ncbi:hypothetical protein F4778DRAFT_270087 [Xylariomycetidae sp. FL2044]|nr:hypothetical protein F4778DRAFT_270087 [Xylariomycetidae sp. FL2044]